MDQFLSTYRKDFIWHNAKSFPIGNDQKQIPRIPMPQCLCGAEPGGSIAPRQYVGTSGENYQWSRLGPMAPLLDPKLYPVKVGPAPEFEITRYDQPNTYLRKLEGKYPYLYNVLQSTPQDDIIKRVNEDRLRTTYQMDYSHIDEHPLGNYESLASTETTLYPKSDCSPRKTLPILDCRGRLRPPEDYEEPIHDVVYRFRSRDSPYDFNGTERDVTETKDHHRDTGKDFGNFADVKSPTDNGYRKFDDDSGILKKDGNGRRDASSPDSRRKADESPNAKAADGRPGYRAQVQSNGADGTAPRGRVGDDGRRDGNNGGNGRGRIPGNGNGHGNTERGTVRAVVAENTGEGRHTGSNSGGPVSKTAGGVPKEGDVKSKKMKKIQEDEEAAKKPLPPWSSEYNDVIGQTGTNIIKDKLHQHGGRSSGRSLMERIVMKCRT